jgi:hypothetical protein
VDAVEAARGGELGFVDPRRQLFVGFLRPRVAGRGAEAIARGEPADADDARPLEEGAAVDLTHR